MAVFEYRALTEDGKQTKGVIDADTPKEACAKLRHRGIYVTDIESIEKTLSKRRLPLLSRFRRVKMSELAIVTRQLSTLLSSGVPLSDALTALINQVESHHLQVTLRDVREKVAQGMSLGDAMALHSTVFSDLYVNMIKAGEASGSLDIVLARLADYLQEQYRLTARIWAALTYPIFVVILGTGIVLFLMTFLVPRIMAVLERREEALPMITVFVKGVSDFIIGYWPILIAAAIALWLLFNLIKRTKKGKRTIHTYLLKIPVIGQLLRKQAISRFAVTLSILMRSGLPVLQSLKIVRELVGNELVSEAIDDIHNKVMEGADVSTVMQKHNIFPPVVAYMVAVGEKSGSLEQMLEKVSESYDVEIEIETQKLTSLIGPVMIIILAGVAALIVVSVLLPLLQMSRIE